MAEVTLVCLRPKDGAIELQLRARRSFSTWGSSHIQPKTSVKDFDLTLIQWETRLNALLLPR
jgi:hypothetical protein